MQLAPAETLSRPRLHYGRSSTSLREIGETILLVVVLYALVNLATARFVVDGISMQPTFYTGQFLIVSRVDFLLGEPQRGQIVVFKYPLDPQEDYIKRVIGLPGETVEIRDTLVYVNGTPLDESYINEPCEARYCPDNSWELGANEYFVMGDNRNHSRDSRVFGPVPRQNLIGEALIRYWPPEDWNVLPGYHSQEAQ